MTEIGHYVNRIMTNEKLKVDANGMIEQSITLNVSSDMPEEMIRIAKDGFYIRGKKVPQDDKEAETVYNAFKQWLTWANMTRN